MKPAYTGTVFRGELSFVCHGQSWQSERSAPLGLTVIPQNDSLLVIPSDASGGLRGGDVHEYKVSLAHGADVQWSVPASTIFHPSRLGNDICTIGATVSVDKDSALVWLSKPNIPGAQSRVDQTTSIEISVTSELLYSEFWAPGRHGEDWDFGSIGSKLELKIDGRLRFKERWTLEPGKTAKLETSPPTRGSSVPFGPAGLLDRRMWGIMLANGPRSRELAFQICGELRDLGAIAETGDIDDALALVRVMFPHPVDPIWKNLARIG